MGDDERIEGVEYDPGRRATRLAGESRRYWSLRTSTDERDRRSAVSPRVLSQAFGGLSTARRERAVRCNEHDWLLLPARAISAHAGRVDRHTRQRQSNGDGTLGEQTLNRGSPARAPRSGTRRPRPCDTRPLRRRCRRLRGTTRDRRRRSAPRWRHVFVGTRPTIHNSLNQGRVLHVESNTAERRFATIGSGRGRRCRWGGVLAAPEHPAVAATATVVNTAPYRARCNRRRRFVIGSKGTNRCTAVGGAWN